VVTPQPRARCPPEMPDMGKINKNKNKNEQTEENELTVYYSPPSLASFSAICARCSSRSLFSHSETSLPASSTAATGGLPSCRRPLSLVSPGSPCCTARLRTTPRSLVRSLVRTGPGYFLVCSRMVGQRVFCWLFHCGRFLERCSRVWI